MTRKQLSRILAIVNEDHSPSYNRTSRHRRRRLSEAGTGQSSQQNHLLDEKSLTDFENYFNLVKQQTKILCNSYYKTLDMLEDDMSTNRYDSKSKILNLWNTNTSKAARDLCKVDSIFEFWTDAVDSRFKNAVIADDK